MKNILNYSKSPQPVGSFQKWKSINFLKFYGLVFVLMIPLGIIYKLVSQGFGITYIALDGLSLEKKILLVIVLAPLIEELILRLILKENKRNFYISSLVCFIYVLVNFYLGRWGSLVIALSLLVLLITMTIAYTKEFLNFYSEKNYKYLYFGSILIFGLLHGHNFLFTNSYQMLLIPLLVLPQLLAGTLLSYIRVNYGIVYSIAFHAMVNMIALSFA
ncbi:CPBP family glutamic-type intramembrane protease [Ancylomarina longa]|uniref:CPBP family intramembrane metalloprotease n=1 Tax=Ancylomarina longa TaxID=2487017 RepID=A0A434AEK2_9BACT|nr:CPBP family glutamic-type intramembrane protease [Ancylomarina longa]RUT72820.1 CPBP family intramembrane metalloprotease [Ancylomarina longa]